MALLADLTSGFELRGRLGLSAIFLSCAVTACGGGASTQAPSAVAPVPSERARLEPNKIVYAMRGHERDFRICFMRSPQTRGTVKVAFDVNDQGVVEGSRVVGSTLQASAVESCLLERTDELRFGSLRAPQQGEWTFVFRLVEPMEDREKQAFVDRKQKASRAEVDANAEQDQPSVVIESGSLEVHQIEETVEVGFPLFARCYRDALNRRDRLGGSVKFRLDIDEQGRVQRLSDVGSEMPDPLAVDCIAEGFYAMNFPVPSSGSASALYRLELD
ncbi:MAG TPA: AgmX/PglI C-terminal domain-containing protein [Polyangiaceae bacterium]|nr:AgmX/PglI C-terminal domain-containing protein [Polyangiaceae bacterium]